MTIHLPRPRRMRGIRVHQRGQPIRTGLSGKAAVDFGDIRDAHNGRREVAALDLFADELIEQLRRRERWGALRVGMTVAGHEMCNRLPASPRLL
jgi:hypothetical protein